MVNGVQQGSVWSMGKKQPLFTGGVGDGDIVAQDGYSLQSEGRTPGDEDSGRVDEGNSEVID